MGSGIFIILITIVGFMLTQLNVSIASWYFWIIIGCTFGTYVCGIIDGKEE